MEIIIFYCLYLQKFNLMVKPKFLNNQPLFYQELREKVNEYFELNGIEKTGNFRLFSKAIFLVSVLLFLYIHLVFFTPSITWAIIECILLGFSAASIGFNVMHDGGHGSFSNNPKLNRIAARTLDLLGASSYMWNTKHNVIHHTYTNVEGVDDDINVKPWMRMCDSDPKYKIHKYQYIYFGALYSILYILWVFLLDFSKYFKKKVGQIDIPKMPLRNHITFWVKKAVFYFLFVGLPILKVGFSSWLIGFLIFGAVTGFVISIIFQLAHTVEHTNMVKVVGEPAKVENDWAIHQINTTANFATNNRLINWFTGGLNFQVEHHLFPKISHIHYPKISKIVKDVCAKHNIPYHEYPKMFSAIASHIRFLKKMGTA
jgi:linoleoyl-CoA desaturase